MVSWCCEPNCRSKRPLSLQLPSPSLPVSAHPSIEIAKDDQLVLRVYACDDSVQITVEGLFYS